MSARAKIAEYPRFQVLRDPAVRMGVYVGFLLSVVLAGWVYIANRMPSFESVALERNVAAAGLLAALALVPVLRFFRQPLNLLASGLIAWSLLSLTYRTLCIFFWRLGISHSTFQIFMLGAILYLIVATISWIGTCLWRARAEHISHSRHPLS